MIPFVINSNICVSNEDFTSYDRFMDAIAGNTGNSYITWALMKELGCSVNSLKGHHIQNVYSYDFNNIAKDVEIIKNECTHVILVLQDQIRLGESYGYRLPFAGLKNFLSKIDKPILVAGLGANCFDGYDPYFYQKLDRELVDFLRFLSSKVTSIGVRGYFTFDVLSKLGIKNVEVIGCPSYYEKGRNRIIVKPKWDEHLRLASSTGVPYILPKVQRVYLQDRLPKEERIIKIYFGEKQYLNRTEYSDLINGKYRIFSSIQEWKKDLEGTDFYIGTRVHGSMVALNSGVPTVVMNKDSRAREMCEYMNIPYFPELRFSKSVKCIFDSCDYQKMNAELNEKFDIFEKFLSLNGFEYKPLDYQNGGVEWFHELEVKNAVVPNFMQFANILGTALLGKGEERIKSLDFIKQYSIPSYIATVIQKRKLNNIMV